MVGFDQAAGHGKAHLAEADESDVHVVGPSRLVQFGEHFARDAETVDRGRHAAIDRDLHQDLADLVARDAVGQGALEMRAQFVRPVQDRDHRDVEHAAGLARQFLAAPHGAPAIFVQHLLERLVEAVDAFQGIADIGLAKHGLANLQALVVHFLVHRGLLERFLLSIRKITGLWAHSHAFVLCDADGVDYRQERVPQCRRCGRLPCRQPGELMSGMTPDPSVPAHQGDAIARLKLTQALQRAKYAIAWEQLWPHLARLLTVVGLFLVVSWAGLWLALPFAARAAGFILFVLAAIATLVPLIWFRWPSREQALSRLDRGSGVRHRPATALTDTLSTQDPVSRALLQAQRERTLASIKRIRAGLPSPRLALHDPWALRALVVVMMVAAYFAAGDERALRLGSA